MINLLLQLLSGLFSTPLGVDISIPFICGIIGVLSSHIIKSSYNKNSRNSDNIRITGFELASRILDDNNIHNISITPSSNRLGEEYNGSEIRLSSLTYEGNSVSAVAVSAHEASHAVQDNNHNVMYVFRHKLYPVSNFCSTLTLPLVFAGYMSMIHALAFLGLVAFIIASMFELITIPVEIDASNKAIKYINDHGILTDKNLSNSKKLLRAAAFTYISSFLVSVLNIFRILIIIFMSPNNKQL